MDQKELDAYKAFMYDPKNSHNCKECTMNEGFSAWPESRLPCGQFHCWVDVHGKGKIRKNIEIVDEWLKWYSTAKDDEKYHTNFDHFYAERMGLC